MCKFKLVTIIFSQIGNEILTMKKVNAESAGNTGGVAAILNSAGNTGGVAALLNSAGNKNFFQQLREQSTGRLYVGERILYELPYFSVAYLQR